jgi:transposase
MDFYSTTYKTFFGSLLYNKNVAYEYLSHIAINSIQIHFAQNHITFIDICLNYYYYNRIQFKGSKQRKL